MAVCRFVDNNGWDHSRSSEAQLTWSEGADQLFPTWAGRTADARTMASLLASGVSRLIKSESKDPGGAG